MGKIINFNEAKEKNDPNITIMTIDGNVHVVPKGFFSDVIDGKTNILDLDDFGIIIRSILKEWLVEIKKNA